MAKVRITKTPNKTRVKVKSTPTAKQGISFDPIGGLMNGINSFLPKKKEFEEVALPQGWDFLRWQDQNPGYVIGMQNGKYYKMPGTYEIGTSQDKPAEHGTTMYALADNGLQVEGDKYEMLSPDTLMLKGNTHEKGGTMVNYQGNTVEAEAGEPMSIDNKGEAIVWGNMNIPGTNIKFKKAAKEIGEEEAKALKLANKGTELLNTKNPYDRFQMLGFNSGKVMDSAAKMKQQALKQAKQMLGDTQQGLLEVAKLSGKDPKDVANTMANGGYIPLAASGETMAANNRYLIRQAAARYGIPQYIAQRLVGQESSGGKQGLTSKKGAKSFAQIMPDTARSLGLDPAKLSSDDPRDRYDVADAAMRYLKQQIDANNGDIGLGLVAYNGGPEAVNHVKRALKQKNITFDQWNQYQAEQRRLHPSKDRSKWRYETSDYANNIMGLSGKEFYGDDTTPSKAVAFNKEFYTPEQTPPITVPIPTDPSKETQIGQYDPVPMNPLTVEGSINNPYGFKVPKPVGEKKDEYTFNNTKPKLPSIADQMHFDVSQILPELYTVFDRPDFVRGQQFDPTLYTPYNVSFQDKLNENNATFRQTAQQLSDNPAALATLAGQKYQQDNAVLSEQFRTNQGIENDVINKNNQLLNQAKMTNLQLQDQQFTRQEQAKANTEQRRLSGLQSLANKYANFKKDKFDARMMEQFSNYRIDPKTGDLKYMGADPNLSPYAGYVQPSLKKTTKTDDEGNTTTTSTYDPLVQEKLRKQRGISNFGRYFGLR